MLSVRNTARRADGSAPKSAAANQELHHMESVTAGKSRITAIDLARGLALAAMATYHFQWDLEFFGYAEPGVTAVGGWKLFARMIASSFLFLAGVSLFLAHQNGFRLRSFVKRMARIVAAAALITAATWFATPDSFIFFGILHAIALSSVLGLAVLRLPWFAISIIACFVVAAPLFARMPVFDYPVLWWVGLSTSNPLSNDYVPIFPWFGPFLFGVAAAKLAKSTGLFDRLAMWQVGGWSFPFQFAGQHSLMFYLVHQPVLIGLVWLFSQVAPADIETREVQFLNSCNRTCAESANEEFCARYCVCVLNTLESENRLDDVFANNRNAAQQERLASTARLCTNSVNEMQ